MSLRYGIVGGGFLPAFMLRALTQVRGVEVKLMEKNPARGINWSKTPTRYWKQVG